MRCEQFALHHYMKAKLPQVEPTISLLQARRWPDIVPPCHNTSRLKQAADMPALCFNYIDGMP